jgi:glutamyl-tRNA synthetase
MTFVRVRFAPSPTGELHVGGLRTALFNYLFARKHGGTFILRIEDTDQSRYVPGAEERIIELLDWAGISPDEGPHKGGAYGPYRQSERLPLYRGTAERLIEKGHAYRCYCSTGTLDGMRKDQEARGEATKYDGRCRKLTAAERAANEAQGLVAVIRMHIPDNGESIVVEDHVRGHVAFSASQLDDQVLIKSDGFPTYHLAVVTDDHAMGITDVLRAEEWLPSTPKHLLLYRWLGWDPPQYAHLPLLLNTDRSKMSKRKGDVSVEAYRDQGYLPEALINFIALLGWNAGDDRELYTLEELIEAFSLERIGKAGAVFDRDKLDWMNQQYIQKLSPERLYELLAPLIAKTEYANEPAERLLRICAIVQPRLVRLTDIADQLAQFFRGGQAPLDGDSEAKIRAPEAQRAFADFRARVNDVPALNPDSFKDLMKQVASHTGVKGKSLWEPMRLALTRDTHGPDLALFVEVLGKDETLKRLDRVIRE